jgi:hypothetical protein
VEGESSEVELRIDGVLRSWPRTSLGVIIGGADLLVGESVSRRKRESMPVAHLDDTELFYVEVGEGLPCLVMHGGLGGDHSALHP